MIKNFLEQEENQPLRENEPDKSLDESKKESAVLENRSIDAFSLFAETENEEEKNRREIEESIFIKERYFEENKAETIFQPAFKPDSPAETIRKSGLAYAAAVVLFSSVVFMLILGWFFDLLVGTSPWGIVGGIVIGAGIGFFQFFRITSQIFSDKK